MKQLSLIGLTLIFLLLFNYASASIINTNFSESNSTEENVFKIGSRELSDVTKNLGIIVIDGSPYELSPDETIEIKLTVGGLYVIGYIPKEGYVFDHWEIKGGELRSSEKLSVNVLRVINASGEIIAVYRKRVEITITENLSETETIEEYEGYELPLGKIISLSLHEVIEEHKESISFWIFEHKLLVFQKYVDKKNTIENYQNDLKQRYLEIKERMRELEEKLSNGSITKEEFIMEMSILENELSGIRNSNEKLGHILGNISKEASEELKAWVEERKRIHSEFEEELNALKENIETEIIQTKTKILKTITTKTPPGQIKKTTTTKTPPGQTKTKEDKGKGKGND
jgi:hypothetical protein